MAIQVETFEAAEMTAGAEGQQDCGPEHAALIESLGLEGQKELISAPAGAPAQVCPYREMTGEEFRVYGELCPEKTKVKDYKASAIPLRVLQVYKHAQSLGFFETFEVWSARSQVVKDPVLVGFHKTGWNNRAYILARWGQELEAFPVLAEKAKAAAKERLLTIFRQISSQARAALAEIESGDGSGLAGTNSPSYYWNR